MNSKTLFGIATVLTGFAFLVNIYFSLMLLGLSAMDKAFSSHDVVLIGFLVGVLITHLCGLTIYIRGYRLTFTDKAQALLVYTRGIWTALAMFTVLVLVWSSAVESVLVGLLTCCLAFGGLVLANALARTALKKVLVA